MIPLNLSITTTPTSVSVSRLHSSPFLLPLYSPKQLRPTPPTLATHNLRTLPIHEELQLRGIATGRGRGRGKGLLICMADLSQDAPFAVAIGACLLNSLIFPYTGDKHGDDDEDEDTPPMGATDARFAVMTIISFIPYFNWLSWVFALTDTGKLRYAVYAAVYLAPYLRTNLSLEESWLPIASIVLCIIHIQLITMPFVLLVLQGLLPSYLLPPSGNKLEASVRSGDVNAFAFFNETAKRFGLVAKSKGNPCRRQGKTHEARRRNNMYVPQGQTQSRDEIERRRIPRERPRELEYLDEDNDVDNEMEH